jgi:F0F1-type ATP synthase alpha subunit
MIAAEKSGEIRSINGCVLEVAGLDGGAVGERVILPGDRVGVILLLTREGAAVACLDAPGGLEVGAGAALLEQGKNSMKHSLWV